MKHLLDNILKGAPILVGLALLFVGSVKLAMLAPDISLLILGIIFFVLVSAVIGAIVRD